ncbi:MAG: hypothetical protein ACERKN_04570 [Velocimicrobium sp.]
MLVYMYEHKIIIYAIIALFGVGFLVKIIQAIAYGQLIKASMEMGISENRLMKLIRLRFDTCYKVKLGVHNVDSFVDKYVYSYKFCGISLYTLENMSGQITMICLLVTLFGSILAFSLKCGQDVILSTLTVGACAVLLLIALDMLFSLSSKQKILRIHMKDYLENNLKAKLENEYFLPKEMEAYRHSFFEKEKEEPKEIKTKEIKLKDEKRPKLGIKVDAKAKRKEEEDKIIEEILKEYLV